jgi:hypothetical protein
VLKNICGTEAACKFNGRLYTEIGFNPMKRFGTIVLSILMLYSGVGWALEKCLNHENHPDHSINENHHDSNSALGFSHASEDSFRFIHCALVPNRLGPVTNPTAPRLPRPSERASPITIYSTASVSSALCGPAALREIVAFHFHVGIPRYISLSILHI